MAGLDGEGVASKDGVVVCPVSKASLESVQVLATRHSLVMLLSDLAIKSSYHRTSVH